VLLLVVETSQYLMSSQWKHQLKKQLRKRLQLKLHLLRRLLLRSLPLKKLLQRKLLRQQPRAQKAPLNKFCDLLVYKNASRTPAGVFVY
jgi:hypothetical protein